MPTPSSAIDLLTLEAMSKDHEELSANRRVLRRQEHSHLRQRDEAAWKLLEAVTRLSQVAGECQWSNLRFDPSPFAAPLIDAFGGVCDVMRAQNLGSELDQLDEEQMIAHYGQDKPPALARIGYQTALTALREGIANGQAGSWLKRLAKTLESSGGRHLWYMAYPIVRGLLVGDYRLFRRAEAAGNPAAKELEEQADRTAAPSDDMGKRHLSDRQRWILETMLEHEITSERRRKSRAAVVRLINHTHKPLSYSRDFAALVKRGSLQSREGCCGGVWLAPKGRAEAQRLPHQTRGPRTRTQPCAHT
jgi:hypothetical protein